MIGKMLKFVYHFVIGIFAILGVVVALAMVAVGVFIYRSMEAPRAPAPDLVLTATLEGPLEEGPGSDPFQALLHGASGSFGEIIEALDVAGTDSHVRGVVLDVGRSELGFAQNEELRQAIARFRQSGRFAIAFADSFGEMDSGTAAYHLASACDEIWLQPIGLVGLTGIAIEDYFAKDALAKIGVSFDMRKRREYKTAADALTENAMTPANREMLESLVADLSGTMMADIASARHIPSGKLDALVANAPLTAGEALGEKLIDGIAYSEIVFDDALARAGQDADSMNLLDYLAANRPDTSSDKSIALIYATGEIGRGSGNGMDPFETSTLSQADAVANTIMDATDDESVAAIVLRVDSPGGSAVASETVRGAILRAKENSVPVIVSMGNTAASGGYWISMDANRILAENTTLTGSIGVLAGKPVGEELLKKLGVSWEGIAKGDNALMWSSARPFTAAESARIDALLDSTYGEFTARVAEARSLSPDEVEKIARGRVWTGKQALGLKLVDGIGGLHEAWLAAREVAGISDSETTPLVPYAESGGVWQSIRQLLSDARNWGLESSRIGVVLHRLIGIFSAPQAGTARMPEISVRE